ncbi:MAG: DUF1614 domain-containing protein [Clostridia bacterium]|nr:DUF1614 domain-containing protein [Clostridia bacterium]
MSIGMVLLTATAVLVFFGVTQRVLDKMRMTDKGALLMAAAMFFGSLLPNLRFGSIEMNIGGALVPVGISLYLICTAGSFKEGARAVIGSILTGAAVYFLGQWMPDEPEAIGFDPNYVYGLFAGLTAYLLGRSRRGAFVSGILGVILADVTVALVNWQKGIEQPLVLGGAGMFDVTVISGLTAVILAELVGEAVERFSRGKEPPEHRPIENPVKDHQGGEA